MKEHDDPVDYQQEQERLRRQENNYNLTRYVNRSKKKEQYYKKNIQPRLLSYEAIATTLSDEKDNVENVFDKAELLRALRMAMQELTEDEQQIISDNFFCQEKKRSRRELAEKYGITRQAYDKRVKKILKKLRIAIEMHINGK